jgi:zinc transporter ZupT
MLKQKVNQMSDRLKVFGIVALLGFMAGVIAQATSMYIIPWLISVLPLLGGLTSFMISGIAGAVLTIALISVWAYITGHREH